jgi:hypothetical protein
MLSPSRGSHSCGTYRTMHPSLLLPSSIKLSSKFHHGCKTSPSRKVFLNFSSVRSQPRKLPSNRRRHQCRRNLLHWSILPLHLHHPAPTQQHRGGASQNRKLHNLRIGAIPRTNDRGLEPSEPHNLCPKNSTWWESEHAVHCVGQWSVPN